MKSSAAARTMLLLVGLSIGISSAGAASTAPESRFDAVVAQAKKAMMADPRQALGPVLAAERLADALGSPQAANDGRATAQWLHGEILSRMNQPDEAMPFLQRAIALARIGAPGSKLLADATIARGSAEDALGDVRSALTDFQQAYGIYIGIQDARGQAKALLSIGGIYGDAGDDQRSLRYFAMVPEVYHGDPAIDVSAHNNFGEALKKLKRYPEAEAQYEIALRAARQLGSQMLEVRILTNLASTQLLRGAVDEADRTTLRALAFSNGDEAAEWRPFIWGTRGQIALRRGDLPAADRDMSMAFAGVDLETSPPAFLDFHQSAADLYQRLGRYQLALAHLRAFKRLEDDARDLTTSSSAALLAARFDFATQNLRIDRLKSEKLKQDALFVQTTARNRTMVLGGLLAGGAVLISILLAAFVSTSRSRNRVRAINAELTEANGSLEKALKVKTEFLATTSHEIRTPLNGILGMTQVLLADADLPADVHERVQVVQSAGETMRALVDDILDLSKIESGNLTIERAEVDLIQLLSDGARLWRGPAEAKGLSFELALDDCPRRIEEDEGRLRQIVFNLMSNAIKFSESGSIVLCAARAGEQLLISVRDSGIGIAQDKLSLIFESFRQADGGTTRRYGGTGLGLAICRQLAAAMGGEVLVESTPGEGSLFTLSLPLRLADHRDAAPEASCEGKPAASLAESKLLVLEANPLTQRVIANMLKPHVLAVRAESDTAGVLVLLESGKAVDHIIAEAGSCSVDGEELAVTLRRLAQAAVAAGAKLSILFTPSESLVFQHLVPVGADQIIAKPIGAAALVQTLAGLYATQAASERQCEEAESAVAA